MGSMISFLEAGRRGALEAFLLEEFSILKVVYLYGIWVPYRAVS